MFEFERIFKQLKAKERLYLKHLKLGEHSLFLNYIGDDDYVWSIKEFSCWIDFAISCGTNLHVLDYSRFKSTFESNFIASSLNRGIFIPSLSQIKKRNFLLKDGSNFNIKENVGSIENSYHTNIGSLLQHLVLYVENISKKNLVLVLIKKDSYLSYELYEINNLKDILYMSVKSTEYKYIKSFINTYEKDIHQGMKNNHSCIFSIPKKDFNSNHILHIKKSFKKTFL